jgi:hypothetical protein
VKEATGKVRADEPPPPGWGFDTDTLYSPPAAMSAAVMAAVSDVGPT